MGYASTTEFVKALENKKDDVHSLLKVIDKVKATGERDWSPRSAHEGIVYEASVSQSFAGVKDSVMTSQLGATRLSQKMIGGTPEMKLPSLSKPGEEDVVFLFKDGTVPEEVEQMQVSLTAKTLVSFDDVKLAAGTDMYAAHAFQVFGRRAQKHEGVAGAVKAANGRSLQPYETWYEDTIDKRNGKPPTSTKLKKETTGAGAGDLEIVIADKVEQEETPGSAAKSLMADLTDNLHTPTKRVKRWGFFQPLDGRRCREHPGGRCRAGSGGRGAYQCARRPMTDRQAGRQTSRQTTGRQPSK